MIARNERSDLEAIAASPQIEPLAQKIRDLNVAATHPEALVVFLAGLWVCRSGNALESALHTTDLWDAVRASARVAGNRLPKDAPTISQVRKMWESNEKIGYELLDVGAESSVAVARQAGLVVPRPFRYPVFDRTNMAYADASVFNYLSGMTDDEIARRRALGLALAPNPREQKKVESSRGEEVNYGMPVEFVGVRGGVPLLAATLSARMFPDYDEADAAIEELTRVKKYAGDGLHSVIYDAGIYGTTIAALSQLGLTVISPMKEAQANSSWVPIPEDRRFDGRVRAVAARVKTIWHRDETCGHEIWGVDGRPVTTKPGQPVSWQSTPCVIEDYQLRRREDGTYRPVMTLLVPCGDSHIRVTVDMSKNREDIRDSSIHNALRVLPERGGRYQVLKGWRSAVEGRIGATKGKLVENNRASRLDPDFFQLDLIGLMVADNAVMWDVHVAQHTRCGARQFREIGESSDRASDRNT